MKERLQISKKADSSASKPEPSQLRSPLSTAQAQHRPHKPLTQATVENQQFQHYQFEATKLQIQAKYGNITPAGQEQLTLLQAKMNDLLQKREEDGSRFGHNLAKIAINCPDRLPEQAIQTPQMQSVQPKLNIGQPGDKYEQEADQMAAAVVNQMNTPAIQTQGEEEISPADNLATKRQKFLQEYTVAKKLVQGIDENLPEDKILEQLLKNFETIQFKYTAVSKSPETLLKGTAEGDCQTLTRAFKKVAEEYFGIQRITIESIPKPFLSKGDKTPYQGKEPNCDDGDRWFFQNHYWATWNNKIYDVLFISHKQPEGIDKAKSPDALKSMLMPERDYYETEKGKIVYPSRNKYFTGDINIFQKVINFVKNLSGLAARNLSGIVARIQSLFSDGGDNNAFESLIRELENSNNQQQ